MIKNYKFLLSIMLFMQLLLVGKPAISQVTILSEDWSSSSFATNGWTFPNGQSNWQTGAGYVPTGAVAPSAYFNWSPSVTSYSHDLVSPVMNGVPYLGGDIRLNALIYYNNYSTATLEQFAVEYKTTAASTWTLLNNYTNAGGTFNTALSNVLLPGMAGQSFQIRFRVYGANSFNINGWAVDNINVIGVIPCTGKPSGASAQASSNTPCPGSTTLFSLLNAPWGGMTYQWQRANSAAGPWTNLPSATAQTYSAIVTGTKCYRCFLTCTATGDTAYSDPVCVTPTIWTPLAGCWCNGTHTSSSTTYNINQVKAGYMTNNTTTALNPLPCYTDYTNPGLQWTPNATISIPVLYQGLPTSQQTVDVKVGTGATFVTIWIDQNHDGKFDTTSINLPTSECWSTTAAAPANSVSQVPVQLVVDSLKTGVTRMRVRSSSSSLTKGMPCTTLALGETEDYLINIVKPKEYDPVVTDIAIPTGNCLDTAEQVVVTLANFGTQTPGLILAAPPSGTGAMTLNLHVNGPNGVTTYTQIVDNNNTNSSGFFLQNSAQNIITVTFPSVNLYAGGNYSINTSLSVPNVGAVSGNGYAYNDSLYNPVTFTNVRPTPGPDVAICQGSTLGFGQGLTVSGCGNVLYDSVEIVFNVTPCIDNIGATASGNYTTAGANALNQYAGQLADAMIPTLPTNSPNFYKPAVLTVNNWASPYSTEARFILSKSPNPVGLSGYPQIYNPALITGGISTANSYGQVVSTGGTVNQTNPVNNLPLNNLAIRKYVRNVDATTLGQIFSNQGQPIYCGYWESWNDWEAFSDVYFDQGAPTEVVLKVYFSYVPSKVNWYDDLTSTAILDTLVPFNPISATMVNPSSQLSSSNSTGTYQFFATCDGLNCRVPVNFTINPSPAVYQDTIDACETSPGSNQAYFDLNSIAASVSGGVSGTIVTFKQDLPGLITLTSPYLSGSSIIYSNVSALGCESKDSIILQANTIPQLTGNILTGFACAPATVDLQSIINANTVSAPTGSTILYYEDAACTISYIGNPTMVSTTDTVYAVLATNTIPACTDTAIIYVDVTIAGNTIANQAPLNYSICGTVPPVTYNYIDGQTQTYYQSSDCKKVANITDITNGISLGQTVVNEEINCSVLAHNGQPFVNRVYEITPTTQDAAQVCLYYLDQDIADFNDAITSTYNTFPYMTPSNMCITQTHNGSYNTPGHTFTVIPNSDLTITYDPATTVYTVCFDVDSFSHFYLHTQNPVNAALPIHLVNFTGKRVENSSLLKWTTDNEINNDYFMVERSKDGKNFTAISNKIQSKAINGNSTSLLDYTYTDNIPYQGHNYYRLQQTDKDAKVSYSTTVDVYFGDDTKVTLYPNPVKNELNVDMNIAKATTATLKIMDATGRVVKEIAMNLKAGGNTNMVSMEGLADGIYMVHISNNKGLNYSQTIRKN